MISQNKKVQAAEKEIMKMSSAFKNKSDQERTKLLEHPKFKELSKIIYNER